MTSHPLKYPQVTIPTLGTVQGIVDDHLPVAKFLGVPFGTVVKRWRPAVRPEPWEGVRDASKLGPSPPQQTATHPFAAMFSGIATEVVYEEHCNERDCLNCNIYVPASVFTEGHKKDTLPVLIWIYGGGLKYGGNNHPIFDATCIVAQSIALNKDIIVVVLNYRVNYFGFLSSKELVQDAHAHAASLPLSSSSWRDRSIGNWGLLDLIQGLEYVREHIHAFGGDRGRVTIMAESAGSVSVAYLLQIPEAHGLFRRAILISSGTGTLQACQVDDCAALPYFDHLCEVFKDPRLSSVDVSNYDSNLEWVMTGTCADEATACVQQLGACTLEDFAILKSRICPPSESVLFDTIYGVPQTDEEARTISVRIVNGGYFRFSLLQTSLAIRALPSCKLSRFHFDRPTDKIEAMAPGLGAHHMVDLFFTFANEAASRVLSEQEMQFAKSAVLPTWIEFANAVTPEQSSIPLVVHDASLYGTDIGDSSGGDGDGDMAIVFGKDLTVHQEVPVERMTRDEVKFWLRSNAFQAEEAKKGRQAQIGFDLLKPLTSAKEKAQ
ncbi:hypothetical protein BGX28_005436 [Mortierella sp. GBA30]|nr:hypothetical protein BGX28_005436 [Mortierella sp. GBA30]